MNTYSSESKQKDEEKEGFFDLPKEKTCRHPQHNFPSHLYIPPGKGYRHKCPACGNVIEVIQPLIS